MTIKELKQHLNSFDDDLNVIISDVNMGLRMNYNIYLIYQTHIPDTNKDYLVFETGQTI